MKNFAELFILLRIEVGIQITPLIFIALDYWAGIRKAKQRGEKITSDGWKRTVDKVARYYNMMLALCVVDAMQVASLWYLDTYDGCSMPLFPFITVIGALFIAAIEVKSIFESADDKTKKDVNNAALLGKAIADHVADPNKVAQAIVDYLNSDLIKKDNETKS